jgi:hypothetical protein
MLEPEVLGFKISGRLPEGATATDLVLVVTEMLRQKGVVRRPLAPDTTGAGKIAVTWGRSVLTCAGRFTKQTHGDLNYGTEIPDHRGSQFAGHHP